MYSLKKAKTYLYTVVNLDEETHKKAAYGLKKQRGIKHKGTRKKIFFRSHKS